MVTWTFSKLLTSNECGSGIAVDGDCRGQVAENLVTWNVLEFHGMFLKSFMNMMPNSGETSKKEL